MSTILTPTDRQTDQSQCLSVIIPCYNEQATIGVLLQRVRTALPMAEIIVVDDGSTDSSSASISNLAADFNIYSLKNPQRSGKGHALKEGMKQATREWVVIQDADLEYDPKDIATMLALARENPNCAIYGSRYKTSGRKNGGQLANYAAVKFFSLLIFLFYRTWLTDPHTCYKMFQRKLLPLENLSENGFSVCAEITSLLLKKGSPILEVSIQYAPRSKKDGKKIALKDFFSTLTTYFALRFAHKAA